QVLPSPSNPGLQVQVTSPALLIEQIASAEQPPLSTSQPGGRWPASGASVPASAESAHSHASKVPDALQRCAPLCPLGQVQATEAPSIHFASGGGGSPPHAASAKLASSASAYRFMLIPSSRRSMRCSRADLSERDVGY